MQQVVKFYHASVHPTDHQPVTQHQKDPSFSPITHQTASVASASRQIIETSIYSYRDNSSVRPTAGETAPVKSKLIIEYFF